MIYEDHLFDNVVVRHVWDDHANHRLETTQVGDWTPYQYVATLTHEGRLFAATTEYYGDSLPRVFEVIKPKG